MGMLWGELPSFNIRGLEGRESEGAVRPPSSQGPQATLPDPELPRCCHSTVPLGAHLHLPLHPKDAIGLHQGNQELDELQEEEEEALRVLHPRQPRKRRQV